EHDLGERVKELTSLYNISRLLEDAEISTEQFFTRLLTFIPPAWQFPEITCARITYEEKIFNTENFQEAQWRQIAEFKENGKMVGTVEVIYLEEMPEFDEGPFLKEERNLINAIAEHLSIFIERKRSEKMNNRLAAIVDSSDDAIIGETLDGIITSWNTGAAKIYGYMAKEVIGKRINIIVPPDRQDEITQIIDKIKRRERVDHFETDRVTKDGAKIPVSLTISPIEDKQGNVLGASTIARDITERKKAEQQIKESEEKLRSIFNNANDAIFIHDLKGQFLEVNDAACKRLGYSKEDLLKLTPKDIDDPKFAKLVPERTQILLQERQTFFETVHISKKKKKIPVELSSTIITFDGKPAILSIARDITERKKAEKVISDLAKFPSENPNPVLRVTKESVIYTNKKGEILFNAKGGDKIPRLLEEAVYTALDMNTVNKVEIELNNHTYSLDITPIIEEGYANVYGLDITERKKAEKAIADLAKFPSENPNPVLRVTRESVIYTNKKGERLFNAKDGDKIPRLLEEEVYTALDMNTVNKVEFELNNHTYSLLITPIKEEGYANVYGMDITERKKAEKEIQQRNKEISALFEASRTILEYNDFDKSTRAIFGSCAKILGVTVGYIALLPSDQLENQKVFINPGGLEYTVEPNFPIPLRGIRSEVIQYKKTLYHNDIHNSDWAKFLPKGHISLKNVMVAPLIVKNEVQGLLGLANRDGDFNDDDARLATAFAELAAIALVNSNALENLEKSEQRYRNLSNILEQKVKERTLELAAIYEYTPTMLILLDKERRIQKANRSALEFGRHNEQEIIGLLSGEALRCANSLNDPRGCGFAQECQTCKFRNSLLDSFKTRKNCIDVEVKLPFIRNGKKKELNLLVSTIPLIIHDESLVLVNINDITSLKTAEQKLKKSEEKVLNLINNISDVLIEVSMDGIITFISPQIYNIVNYEPDEMMGQNLLNLSHPEEKGMLETRIRSAINSGDLIDINLRILHKKGFYVPISIRGTLVKTDDELKIFAVVS
ncbi:hypothetical protein LCGC14_1685160, partial [marine sediment metagenome]